MGCIKFILELIGVCTVAWFVYIAYEEYRKIRNEENDNE